MKRAKFAVVVFIVACVCVPAAVVLADNAGTQDRTGLDVYETGWLTSDRDDDGRVDYAVQIDERGYKIREAMDFNFDGLMDDFYFYDNDVLQRQEIDSNYDRIVDIWIFMWRGVYVRRWERDTDFDGTVDLIRDYDEPTQ